MAKQLHSREFGYNQESCALQFLRLRGMKLLQRNFTYRTGEIDLIMLAPPEHLVFIEVRYRKSAIFGSAKASVTREKQSRIKRTAAAFLQKNTRLRSLACRYDIVAISGDARHGENIEWIRNAFY